MYSPIYRGRKKFRKINENLWRKLLTKVVGNSIILLAAKIETAETRGLKPLVNLENFIV